MRPDRAFDELTNKHVDEAVENARSHEEFLELQLPLTAEDVGLQVGGEVLNQRCVCQVIREQLVLYQCIGHLMGDAAVVDVPILGQSQAFELVGDPEALFTAHDAERLRMLHLILLDPAISTCRE